MPEQHEYMINIDPRILELLGPSLYTNIYYVLAELIANSYDANASNVYIIQKNNQIIVEDDGTGMSYQSGDIAKYLNVAVETRSTPEDSFTADGKRRKIGRKGVGKLAALSVSENVMVMTVKKGEKSGFILSRHVEENRLLKPLEDGKIRFERIVENGTAIVMMNPQYGMHNTPSAIKNNLIKIFPLVNHEFRIHIITDTGTIILDSFDKDIIQHLGALIILGEEFHYLGEYFDSGLEEKEAIESRLLKLEKAVVKSLELQTRTAETKSFNLEIKGWIGAYRSTRGRKTDRNDFPDNFISLIANRKLGEYNILPIVGKNRLREVYVVGQLHIDLLEETELPDISLSNRQGYKTEDKRYEFVINQVRGDLLPKILTMRELYTDHQNRLKNAVKVAHQREIEEELRRRVDTYKTTASKQATDKIEEKLRSGDFAGIQQIIEGELNETLPIIGIKRKIDAQKKKILICHAHVDKTLADVVYNMLSFNDIPDADIIYTSCNNEGARIPEAAGLFDYLMEFFVNSYSTEKIMVLYVTSNEMAQSWGAVTEVGAGWITKKEHKIFNIHGHTPRAPLDTRPVWHTSIREGENILMTGVEFDRFNVKIIATCNLLGYTPKSKEANEKELSRYVSIID
jgi:hypothetical protein